MVASNVDFVSFCHFSKFAILESLMGDTVGRLCGPKLGLSSACVEELGPTGRQTSSERSQDLPLEASGPFWKFAFSTKFSSFFRPHIDESAS